MIKTAAHALQSLLDIAEINGLPKESIAESTGVDLQRIHSDTLIDPGAISRVLQYLWQTTGDEHLGLTQHPVKLGLFATMCKLASSCDSLHEAICEGLNLYDLVTDDFKLEMRTDERRARLIFHIPPVRSELFSFLLVMQMTLWHRFSSWLIGKRIPLNQIDFPFSRPPHEIEYQRIFPYPRCYDAAVASIEFDSKYLDYRPVRSRKEVLNFLKHSPAELMHLQKEPPSIERQLRRIIRDASGQAGLCFPTLPTIAEHLCMSEQTLRRRLKDEGTSFRTIKDLIRRDMAIEQLIGSNLSVTDIATLVGFTETATLTRAFKGWTGLAPADYRQRYKHQPPS